MADGPMRRLLRVVRHIAEPDAGPLSDERLLERFAATGDEAAFELLVRRHGAMVLGVCRRALRDAHAAEDAFQATFLVLARKARSVRHVASYLYGVAGRVTANERRKAARRLWHERRVAVAEAVALTGDDADLRAVLDEELGQLPARFRLPVVLCYLKGHTTAEAARRLGCPRGTVLSRLAAARLRLKARLTRRGLALPAGGLAAALAGPAEVPASLVLSTVRASLAFAAGRAVLVGAAAPQVVTLAEGAMRSMLMSKLTITAAVLAVGLVGSGAGWVAWPAAGPGPAFAEAAPQPAKAGEAKAVARHDEDQPRNAPEQDVRAMHDQLEKLTVQLAELEDKVTRERTQARVALVLAEERLRQLQREQDSQREAQASRIRVLEQENRRLHMAWEASRDSLGSDHPEVRKNLRALELVTKDLQEALDTYKRGERDRLGELVEARSRVIEAEEKLEQHERRAATQRQHFQAAREAVHHKLLQAQHGAPRAGSADARFDELEQKISELLREVKELRRELRK